MSTPPRLTPNSGKVLTLTTKIVEENKLTCLMITHNMASALDHLATGRS